MTSDVEKKVKETALFYLKKLVLATPTCVFYVLASGVPNLGFVSNPYFSLVLPVGGSAANLASLSIALELEYQIWKDVKYRKRKMLGIVHWQTLLQIEKCRFRKVTLNHWRSAYPSAVDLALKEGDFVILLEQAIKTMKKKTQYVPLGYVVSRKAQKWQPHFYSHKLREMETKSPYKAEMESALDSYLSDLCTQKPLNYWQKHAVLNQMRYCQTCEVIPLFDHGKEARSQALEEQKKAKKRMRCSQCKVATFCSTACQKKLWKYHREHCATTLVTWWMCCL